MKKFLRFTLLVSFSVAFAMNTLSAQTKICVISDVHYFEPSLLVNNGTAFQSYLASDRKLLQESDAITTSVIDSLLEEAPDYVLIPGDLTKDGEKICHDTLAVKHLAKLEAAGIEVLVIDGNHDINNPHAEAFDGGSTIDVDSVSPADFQAIYADYGYNQAAMKDTASLSYTYNLSDDIVLLAMDVCNYDTNYVHGSPVTSGRFTNSVYQWCMDRIEEAVADHKVIMGMMHHGMLEHYSGQKALFSEYVVDGYDTISVNFAEAGMNVVFTGHYHSQDLAGATTTNSSIFDVETGSTVTYPCPYRIIEISETTDTTYTMEITGKKVQDIDYDLNDATDFQEYAKDFIDQGMSTLVYYMLTTSYGLDAATATYLEPGITETLIAHYEGNEGGTPSANAQTSIAALKGTSGYETMGAILEGIWADSYDDWTYSIQLNKTKAAEEEEATALANLSASQIKVYPNPVTEYFTIEGNFSEAAAQVNIYTVNGQKVYSQTLNSDKTQIQPALKPQAYIIEIETAGLKMSKQLLVK